ncbi:MAG TPA: methyltransferase domain-containing protein [Pseudomonadota bacterium]|nr:methyltransferase domain-containing protein [Pseudomonadota bacterium]
MIPSSPTESVLYGDILAEIHTRWFAFVAESAARHVEKSARALAPYDLLDLGCGSGVICEKLKPHCKMIYGIDCSLAMIQTCRALVPDGHFTTGDILDVDLPSADVVVMVGEILGYAMSRSDRTTDVLERFLRMVRERTRPGGIFLFDVLGNQHDYSGTFFHEHAEYTICSQVTTERDIVTRRIVSFLRRGPHYEKSVETHRLRTFDAAQLSDLLSRCGWNVRRLTHYDTAPLLPGRLAFECRADG